MLNYCLICSNSWLHIFVSQQEWQKLSINFMKEWFVCYWFVFWTSFSPRFPPKWSILHGFSGVIPRLSNVPFILSLCILRYYPSQLYSIEKSGADCLSTTSPWSIWPNETHIRGQHSRKIEKLQRNVYLTVNIDEIQGLKFILPANQPYFDFLESNFTRWIHDEAQRLPRKSLYGVIGNIPYYWIRIVYKHSSYHNMIIFR